MDVYYCVTDAFQVAKPDLRNVPTKMGILLWTCATQVLVS